LDKIYAKKFIHRCNVRHIFKYSSRVKQDILKLNQSSFDDLESSKAMGYQISKICIPLISQLLDQKQLKSTDIQAIGFHGPTIRHQPN